MEAGTPVVVRRDSVQLHLSIRVSQQLIVEAELSFGEWLVFGEEVVIEAVICRLGRVVGPESLPLFSVVSVA
jgi:hypothetical protein